ncbi:DUF6232 family protein [Kitasatospora sp. NPDC058170]|uniref:DUF6232 family protein n=1 Tax=Kitasatospora sp. NPDC058170 TaxID=3346364 RepID=UPI0036D9602B
MDKEPDRPRQKPPPPPVAAPAVGVPTAGVPTSFGPPAVLPMAVGLRVSKRLLWVGGAVYPLHNIVRVYSFVLRPKRREALGTFAKRILQAGLLAAVPFLLATTDILNHSSDEEALRFVVYLAGAWLVYAVIELLSVLFARSVPVLAVDTAGNATAMVTTVDERGLAELVKVLSQALENPEVEFQMTVQTLTVSPKNYHFGDNVNMYGGIGNTGKAAR